MWDWEWDRWLYNDTQVVDLWWSDGADIHIREKISTSVESHHQDGEVTVWLFVSTWFRSSMSSHHLFLFSSMDYWLICACLQLWRVAKGQQKWEGEDWCHCAGWWRVLVRHSNSFPLLTKSRHVQLPIHVWTFKNKILLSLWCNINIFNLCFSNEEFLHM